MAQAQWTSYVPAGRFKTARRKKRLVKENFDKQLLQYWREYVSIMKQQRNLGFIDLVPPIQRGWKRFFVLREDLHQSKDAAFFIGLLEKINTTQYSHRSDFKKKRRFRGRKIYVERGQQLRTLYSSDVKKLKLTEKELSYFRIYDLDVRGRGTDKIYVFGENWRFVLRAEPDMITQRRRIDPDLECRRKQLDNFLDRSGHYPRLFKLLSGHHFWREADTYRRHKTDCRASIDYDELRRKGIQLKNLNIE